MLTYPKSTMRVRRMPMHLSSGHMTGAEEILPPPLISPQSDLGRGRTHVGLCPKFLVLFMFYHKKHKQHFSTRKISEMRGPTGVKFCTMVSNRHYFIMPVQNLGGAPQKNFRGQKHAKFSPISNDLEVRQRISPKVMKILKIG